MLSFATVLQMVFAQLAAFSLRASAIVIDQHPVLPTNTNSHNFDWDNVEAQESFVWHDCFSKFKCARLQVPMDWHHNTTESDRTVELAVIKLEATVPITDSTYGGAVFFNPGGPGDSGVAQVINGGHQFRTIVSAGPDNNSSAAKNFDIISFDPRGVNNTRPALQCFPNHLELATWVIEQRAVGYIGDTATSFDNLWSRYRAVAEGCSQRAAKDGIGKHMSSAPVARDVVEVFERHGEWRAAEAQRLLESATIFTSEEQAAIRQRTAYKKGAELVHYWGFSYGSILGAHIAAMFPDRISRLVVDGVVNSHDYMAGGWTTNLQDTDMAFLKLAEYCWAGGRDNCPLWHEDGPAAIIDRVVGILEKFRQNPVGRQGNATHGPASVNHHDYETMIRSLVYNLLRDFPVIVQTLHELEQNRAPMLEAFKVSQTPPIGKPLSKSCLTDGPYSPSCHRGMEEFNSAATWGIACSDGLPRTKQTKEEYKEYADTIIAQSSLIGASWAEIQMPCTAWQVRPAWRYSGDFVARTAHPILFIGNTYDPVTPVRNAFTMAKGFDGAIVLQQDSEGHCSYASPSMCTGKALRRYFQTGEMPRPEDDLDFALCTPDMLPLQGYVRGSRPAIPKGETDIALWNALVDINQYFP
ncbi:hypothetical protein AMS68_003235 [Peltaster fructicola]|uniref:Peptidase S33 tripeptidyl aminopeptidase-like C-terminal domain-containing protein n=1 Tax=Peltaster fructicola TaxID=286661 RepID=A0A6H0XSX6_9PEZI|nr:hypothetical protein AMS68_003235 [Peltaster fructicola]